MNSLFQSNTLLVLHVDDNVKAAIIGFWRMGATIDEIMEVVNLRYMIIEQIIKDYERN